MTIKAGWVRRGLALLGVVATLFAAPDASATPFTTTVPDTGVQLPDSYPEAGGVAVVLTGANGNIYYQFSDPSGAFVGFQNRGTPSRFNGNPFTINDPINLECGFRSCTDYFGGSIVRMDIRFSAYDGDTQVGGFDFNRITLRINGFDVGNWSGRTTDRTNNSGTRSFGQVSGFGNNTFNTGWFSSTNPALLSNILSTNRTVTQVFDQTPNDNYWDFTRGPSLGNQRLRTIAPGLEFTKTITAGATFGAVGDTVSYRLVASNIGSVDIDDVIITDDRIAALTCGPDNDLEATPSGSASTPQQLICTADYRVTQADIDAGTIVNTANATGEPAFGSLGDLQASATATGPARNDAVSLVKSGGPDPFGNAGSQVTYTFTVTNDGNTTLRNVAVTDPRLSGFDCDLGTILPRSADTTDNTASCTGTYTVTQGDVDAFVNDGTALTNTARVDADGAAGPVFDTASADLDGPAAAPALTVAKTALDSDFGAVGDTLNYSVAVTNTGNVGWTGPPTVTDVIRGVSQTVTCPAGAVAVGATVTCSVAYDVEQADLDAGVVDNLATATITVGGQTASGSDGARVTGTQTSGLTILKRLAAPAGAPFDAVGDTLTYEYVLTNTGNTPVTLAADGVRDDRIGVTCPVQSIAPNGGQTTCTSDAYDVTQEDLDAGGVTNTASATAQDVNGDPVVSPPTSLTVAATQRPSLAIVKVAPNVDPDDFVEGLRVTYEFTVNNTGNVTAEGPIRVTDDRIGAPFECAPGDLAPGGSIDCTGDYTVTEADEIAGFVTNTAFAQGATGPRSPQTSQTIPQEGSPAIGIEKEALTADFDDTSDVLQYRFTVTNTGNVAFDVPRDTITIVDPSVTLDPGCTPPGGTLFGQNSPNTPKSFVCTGSFAGLTQADIDAGEFVNTARAEVEYAPGAGGTPATIVSPDSAATVASAITPDFTLTKTSTGAATFDTVGDTLTYTFEIENLTNQTLASVEVTDPLIPGLSCAFTDVGPRATVDCTGTYDVDQADLDAGSVLNTARAVGVSPTGTRITRTDDETVDIDATVRDRLLSLEKTRVVPAGGSATTFAAAGETVEYILAVTNDGVRTIRDVVIRDEDLGATCTVAALAPGATDGTCRVSRTTTQADVEAGEYTNTATASATDVAPVNDALTLTGPTRAPAVDLTKLPGAPEFDATGDVVRFTLRVENTGNVTLTNLLVEDPDLDTPLSCSIPSLAPGAVDLRCVGTRTVTPDDVDIGFFDNTATVSATGTNAAGTPTGVNDSDTVRIDGPAPAPAIRVTKTERDGSNSFAGGIDEVFNFAVTNTGTVTLTNVTLTDDLTGFTCSVPTLAPSQTVTTCEVGASTIPASTTYTPDQDDVDAGRLTNIVTVSGQDRETTVVTDTARVDLNGPAQDPSISLAKTSTAGGGFTAVGDVLEYVYTVTNTGNITLTAPITVTDDRITVSCPALPPGGVAPGGTLVCTASDTATQADLDAGEVQNTAEAFVSQPVVPSPLNPTGVADERSGEQSLTLSATQAESITLTKRLKPGTAQTFDGPGDLSDAGNANNLTFEFLVRNDGNVTLTDAVTITDLDVPGTPFDCSASPVVPLAPGDTLICELAYAPTQGDVDAGGFTNRAQADTTFDGRPVTDGLSSVTVPAVQRPELTLTKMFRELDNPTQSFAETEVAIYDFTVTNVGNTTLPGPIEVEDNLIGTITCQTGPLTPGDSVTCEGRYTITADDVDLGSVTNVAFSTAGGVRSPEQTETIPEDVTPALSLTKVADTSVITSAGQVVTYTYTVENTSTGAIRPAFGNAITVEDDRVGTVQCPFPSGSSELAVDDPPLVCDRATDTVTQADLDAVSAEEMSGFLRNVATARTLFRSSTNVVSNVQTVVIPGASGQDVLSVEKSFENLTDPGNAASLGDEIEFTVLARNDGPRSLSGVTVSDAMLPGLTCAPAAPLTLAPDAQTVCTGIYTVRQSDLDDESLTNRADAQGAAPDGTVVQGSDTESVPLTGPAPELRITKTLVPTTSPVAGADFTDPGAVLQFRIEVENIGNITVDSITVTDDLVGVTPASCAVGTLAPGDAPDTSCLFEYTVTQEDVDRGSVANTARANGAARAGTVAEVSDGAGASGPDPEPGLGVSKVAIAPLPGGGFDTAGQVIDYVYTIANQGNVTLTLDPTFVDDRIPSANFAANCDPLPAGGLRPSETFECTASYTVTQDNVDAGTVTNLATFTFPDEYGTGPVVGTGTETVDGARTPSLRIDKTPSATTGLRVDDEITYSYLVTNTGNTRLTSIRLIDAQTSAAGTANLTIEDGGEIAILQPGDDATLTATYTVTQDDIDAGAPLTNIVTASADSPPGTTVDDATDDASVALQTGDGQLQVRKTVTTAAPATPKPGDTVIFEVTVENIGNVTLDDVALTDSVTRNGETAPLPGGPVPVFRTGDGGIAGALEVGETWVYDVTYALTQGDIDAGGIANSVTVDATDPQDRPVSDISDNGTGAGDAPTPVTFGRTPALEILKTVRTLPTDPVAGNEIVFAVTVENTGNLTLTDPTFAEDLRRADDAPVTTQPTPVLESGDTDAAGVFEVGELRVYTVTYALEQADIDAGGLSNSVVGSAFGPGGGAVSDTSDLGTGDGDDPTPAILNGTASLEAVKTLVGTAPAAPLPGAILRFEIAVENTGNLSLTAPVIVDRLTPVGGVAADPAPVAVFDRGDTDEDDTLDVGETWIYVVDHALRQADIDAGGLTNSAVVTADDPMGVEVSDVSDDDGPGDDPTAVTLTRTPGIETEKVVLNAPTVAGDTVRFEIRATNTGNVTLTGVDVTDEALTRADTTPLTLASGPDFVSSNRGSVPGSIIPGETAIFRATYILTQPDVDAGGVSNVATVGGRDPTGTSLGDPSDPAAVTILAAPELALVKRLTSGQASVAATGEVLSYAFDVTNRGNVTAGAVTVADPRITDAGGTVNCPATLLAPGARLTCTADYTVTQADIDAPGALLENTATASDGVAAPVRDGVTVPVQQTPALTLAKSAASVTVDGVTQPGVPPALFRVGAVVTYDFTVTNTGNTTLTATPAAPLTVTDNLIGTFDCVTSDLRPGAAQTCQATYTVTVDDVDLGSVTNLAAATVGGVTAPPVTETVPAGAVPALSTNKALTGITDAGGTPKAAFDTVGDLLRYDFTVTNTGQAALVRDISVRDARLDDPVVCFTSTAANPDFTPGETAICSATIAATQADLDAGELLNTAFAQTTFGASDRIVVSDVDSVTTPAGGAAAMTLDKAATTLPITGAGQVLTYTLTATNTGNRTLRAVAVDDPLLPGFTCRAATLAPGGTLVCAGDYTVTQDDIDAGLVVNEATATSVDPGGAGVGAEATLTLTTPDAAPGVALVKSATPEPFGAVGTTIEYRFAVRNTGNVTLTDVVVRDEIVTPPFTCTLPVLAVGANDATTCVLGYAVTPGDVDAGEIVNTATVAADGPRGTTATGTDTRATDGAAAEPALRAQKTAVLTGDPVAGSVVEYTLTLRNTGNVSLAVTDIADVMTRTDGTAIALDAPFRLLSGDANGDGRIDLAETWTYAAGHTLDQGDVDAGGVSNRVTVTGAPRVGPSVTDVADDGIDGDGNTMDDPTDTALAPAAGMSVVKTVKTAGAAAGEEVVFQVVATNLGNVTLTDLVLADTMANDDGLDVSAGVSDPVRVDGPAALAPNESSTWELRYTLTQADVDSGGLTNSVMARALSPLGEAVDDMSDNGLGDGSTPTLMPIVPAPAATLVKTAGAPERAGGTAFDVAFTLVAENTGNVTLTDLSLIDDLAAFADPAEVVSVSDLSATGFATGGANAAFDGDADAETLRAGTSLAPGEVGTVSFTLRIDTETGVPGRDNVATLTAPRLAEAVSASVAVDVIAPTGLVATKSVSPGTALLGETVTYTIEVENTGDFVETGLTLVDRLPAGLVAVPGSGRIDGDAVPGEAVAGRTVTWSPLTLNPGDRLVATLAVRVTEGPGEFVNSAFVRGPAGDVLSNVATATLVVRPEAVFDCGDVIGRVFDDVNLNGYYDGPDGAREDGITDQTFGGKGAVAPAQVRREEGLPRVRIATVDGTVITTDDHGRFNVPCAALPRDIGSNFTLKLDPSSLPTGYHITTENPRTIRLTPGTLAKMNFGAALADVVDVALTGAAFAGAQPSAGLVSGIDGFVGALGEAPVVLRLTYTTAGEGRDTARARLDAVERLIRGGWPRGRPAPVIERTIAGGR
ncbi:beta strand repeat-containing protein [Jannaschia donghaensis]|uniref:DUF11 domain-containing protein n=1 Tax=Jannaschia donghaensis TaxID=420998 RepID=A0A0M6YDM1_9RHOB|nr:DUF11 domain-containing protein [Jannaschia donghaensis]CTQ48080.1 hypothetical protein JDO7802_00081 [Jannaschia donghaensis]